jgi:hypothetical protein
MSDAVSVALNSNLGTAAPLCFRDDVDKAGNSPSRGLAWAFLVAIDLPAAACSADGRADCVDQAKQTITQLLTPVEENGSLSIVKHIVVLFNCETLLQQNQSLHTVLVCYGYVQLFRPQCRTTVEGWLPQPCKWTVVPGGLHGLLYQFLVQLG